MEMDTSVPATISASATGGPVTDSSRLPAVNEPVGVRHSASWESTASEFVSACTGNNSNNSSAALKSALDSTAMDSARNSTAMESARDSSPESGSQGDTEPPSLGDDWSCDSCCALSVTSDRVECQSQYGTSSLERLTHLRRSYSADQLASDGSDEMASASVSVTPALCAEPETGALARAGQLGEIGRRISALGATMQAVKRSLEQLNCVIPDICEPGNILVDSIQGETAKVAMAVPSISSGLERQICSGDISLLCQVGAVPEIRIPVERAKLVSIGVEDSIDQVCDSFLPLLDELVEGTEEADAVDGASQLLLLKSRMEQSREWVDLKVMEMTPGLTQLGDNLEEALHLQQQHDEVLRKLASKQSPVEELLKQADKLIANQKPKAEIYSAMAESLGLAWRDLNNQLQAKRRLLQHSVSYHSRLRDFSGTMELAERVFGEVLIPPDAEAARQSIKQLTDVKKLLLEASMVTLQDGNQLMEQLQLLCGGGSVDSRPDHLRVSIQSACAHVENKLEKLHDRRRCIEFLFVNRRAILDQRLAIVLLYSDLDAVRQQTDSYTDDLRQCSDLGHSFASTEALLIEHNKLQLQAKHLQDRGLHLLRQADDLVRAGTYAREEPRHRAYSTLDLCTQLLAEADRRQQLLTAASRFYSQAKQTFDRLSQLESELKVVPPADQTRVSDAVQEATSPALQLGNQLLDQMGKGAEGSEGVSRCLDELNRAAAGITSLSNAHLVENITRPAGQFYRKSMDKCASLSDWMTNTGEVFFASHTSMGQTREPAKQFLNLHHLMRDDIAAKGDEIDMLLFNGATESLAGELEVAQMTDLRREAENLKNRCSHLQQYMDCRLKLLPPYVEFHELATNLQILFNDLKADVSSGDSTDNAIRRTTDRWLKMQQQSNRLSSNGRSFMDAAYQVCEGTLDWRRACLCVESILEHFREEQLQITERQERVQRSLAAGKQLQREWKQCEKDSHQTVEWIGTLQQDLYPVLTGSEASSEKRLEQCQQKSDSVIAVLQRALTDLDLRLRTTDKLKDQGDIGGGTDLVASELTTVKEKLSITITEYHLILQMMSSYFKNLKDLDANIDKQQTRDELRALPSDPSACRMAIKEIESSNEAMHELFRFSGGELSRLEDKVRSVESSVAGEQDVERLHEARTWQMDRWEAACSRRRALLDRQMSAACFDAELNDINSQVKELSGQLATMYGHYGETLREANMTSQAFQTFQNTIQNTGEQVESFVGTAQRLVAESVEPDRVQNELDSLQNKWSTFRKQVDDYRKRIDLAIDYFTLVEKAEDWYQAGGKLLVEIAKKSTQARTPQEAQTLRSEINLFLSPGEGQQEQRMRRITVMAEELYGVLPAKREMAVRQQTQDMLESYRTIDVELNTLVQSLRQASEEKQSLIMQNDQLSADMRAAKQEAKAARAAASAAQEARRAAEAAALALEQMTRPITPLVVPTVDVYTETVAEVHKRTVDRATQELPVRMSDACTQEEHVNFVDAGTQGAPCWSDEEVQVVRHQEFSSQVSRSKRYKKDIEHSTTAPVFLSPLQDQHVQDGVLCSLQTRVSGVPSPMVSWLKNGVSCGDAPGYSIRGGDDGICCLTIGETRIQDSGVFTCRAWNSVGSVETSANFTVKGVEPEEKLTPPVFIRHPQSGHVQEGHSHQLKALVTGHPLPLVSWFLNGSCVDSCTDYDITYNNGECVLKMEEARSRNQGVFLCRATNAVGCDQSQARLRVGPVFRGQIPQFIAPLCDITVHTGASLKLETLVQGVPQPDITWLHNGQPVSDGADTRTIFDGRRAALSSTVSCLKHAGSYSVVARNSSGETRSSCIVIVQDQLHMDTTDCDVLAEGPRVVVPLMDVTAEQGSRLQIGCVIKGIPEPEVVWYISDEPVVNSPDLQLVRQGDRCSLVITAVRPRDAGRISVVAINPAGERQSTCILNVFDARALTLEEGIQAPKFVKRLRDVRVKEGESCVLDVEVYGMPRPEVVWRRGDCLLEPTDNVKIWESDGAARLEIGCCMSQQAGTYTCVARSRTGEVSTASQVTVIPAASVGTSQLPDTARAQVEAPSFLQPFRDQRVSHGDDVLFQCVIGGKPAPTVKWLFDDRPLPSWKFSAVSEGQHHVLRIRSAQTMDSGEVKCVAENESGKATCVADLSVQEESAPTAESLSTDTSLLPESSPFDSTVKTSTTKSSVFTKFHEETQVIDGSLVSQHSALEKSSEESHSSPMAEEQPKRCTYESYQIGQGVSPSITEDRSTVDGPPKIPSAPDEASQEHSVQRQELKSESMTKDVRKQLVARPVISAQPPRFLSPIQGLFAKEGDEIKLEGVYSGRPQPEVVWHKDDADIQKDEHHASVWHDHSRVRLTVDSAANGDAGKYTCTLTNPAGKAVSSADVIIRKCQFPPVFDHRLKAQVLQPGQRAMLEVTVSGTPRPDVSWLKDGQRLTGRPPRVSFRNEGSRHMLVIEDVVHEDSGKYSIHATNPAGEATSIADIVVSDEVPVLIEKRSTSQQMTEQEYKQWSEKGISAKTSGVTTAPGSSALDPRPPKSVHSDLRTLNIEQTIDTQLTKEKPFVDKVDGNNQKHPNTGENVSSPLNSDESMNTEKYVEEELKSVPGHLHVASMPTGEKLPGVGEQQNEAVGLKPELVSNESTAEGGGASLTETFTHDARYCRHIQTVENRKSIPADRTASTLSSALAVEETQPVQVESCTVEKHVLDQQTEAPTLTEPQVGTVSRIKHRIESGSIHTNETAGEEEMSKISIARMPHLPERLPKEIATPTAFVQTCRLDQTNVSADSVSLSPNVGACGSLLSGGSASTGMVSDITQSSESSTMTVVKEIKTFKTKVPEAGEIHIGSPSESQIHGVLQPLVGGPTSSNFAPGYKEVKTPVFKPSPLPANTVHGNELFEHPPGLATPVMSPSPLSRKSTGIRISDAVDARFSKPANPVIFSPTFNARYHAELYGDTSTTSEVNFPPQVSHCSMSGSIYPDQHSGAACYVNNHPSQMRTRSGRCSTDRMQADLRYGQTTPTLEVLESHVPWKPTNRVSHIKGMIEFQLDEVAASGSTVQQRGGVRTFPARTPDLQKQTSHFRSASPASAVSPVGVPMPMEKFPPLEPFPYTPDTPRMRSASAVPRGSAPTPNRFVPARFAESDYEGDMDERMATRWRPDGYEYIERRRILVNLPHKPARRCRSEEKPPTPPSEFEHPQPLQPPSRSDVDAGKDVRRKQNNFYNENRELFKTQAATNTNYYATPCGSSTLPRRDVKTPSKQWPPPTREEVDAIAPRMVVNPGFSRSRNVSEDNQQTLAQSYQTSNLQGYQETPTQTSANSQAHQFKSVTPPVPSPKRLRYQATSGFGVGQQSAQSSPNLSVIRPVLSPAMTFQQQHQQQQQRFPQVKPGTAVKKNIQSQHQSTREQMEDHRVFDQPGVEGFERVTHSQTGDFKREDGEDYTKIELNFERTYDLQMQRSEVIQSDGRTEVFNNMITPTRLVEIPRSMPTNSISTSSCEHTRIPRSEERTYPPVQPLRSSLSRTSSRVCTPHVNASGVSMQKQWSTKRSEKLSKIWPPPKSETDSAVTPVWARREAERPMSAVSFSSNAVERNYESAGCVSDYAGYVSEPELAALAARKPPPYISLKPPTPAKRQSSVQEGEQRSIQKAFSQAAQKTANYDSNFERHVAGQQDTTDVRKVFRPVRPPVAVNRLSSMKPPTSTQRDILSTQNCNFGKTASSSSVVTSMTSSREEFRSERTVQQEITGSHSDKYTNSHVLPPHNLLSGGVVKIAPYQSPRQSRPIQPKSPLILRSMPPLKQDCPQTEIKHFPELEPFPFKPANQQRARPPRGPSLRMPSKFHKGEMRSSDYESDTDGRIPALWRPTESGDEDPEYRGVRPALPRRPAPIPTVAAPAPLPPSAFDQSPLQLPLTPREPDVMGIPLLKTPATMPTRISPQRQSPPRLRRKSPPQPSDGVDAGYAADAENTIRRRHRVSCYSETADVRFQSQRPAVGGAARRSESPLSLGSTHGRTPERTWRQADETDTEQVYEKVLSTAISSLTRRVVHQTDCSREETSLLSMHPSHQEAGTTQQHPAPSAAFQSCPIQPSRASYPSTTLQSSFMENPAETPVAPVKSTAESAHFQNSQHTYDQHNIQQTCNKHNSQQTFCTEASVQQQQRGSTVRDGRMTMQQETNKRVFRLGDILSRDNSSKLDPHIGGIDANALSSSVQLSNWDTRTPVQDLTNSPMGASQRFVSKMERSEMMKSVDMNRSKSPACYSAANGNVNQTNNFSKDVSKTGVTHVNANALNRDRQDGSTGGSDATHPRSQVGERCDTNPVDDSVSFQYNYQEQHVASTATNDTAVRIPSKFVKGEMRESDYESDYEGRIAPKWNPKSSSINQEASYRPVRLQSEQKQHSSQYITSEHPSTEALSVTDESLCHPDHQSAQHLLAHTSSAAIRRQEASPCRIPRLSPQVARKGLSTPCDESPKTSRTFTAETSHNGTAAQVETTSSRIISRRTLTERKEFSRATKIPILSPPMARKAMVHQDEQDLPSRRGLPSRTSDASCSANPTKSFAVSRPQIDTVSHQLEVMPRSFGSKTRQFSGAVNSDIKGHQSQLCNGKGQPISSAAQPTPTNQSRPVEPRRTPAMVYRNEERAIDSGTAPAGSGHSDEATNLVYFKYDFGYEFGLVAPAERRGVAAAAAEDVQQQVEVPVQHVRSGQLQRPSEAGLESGSCTARRRNLSGSKGILKKRRSDDAASLVPALPEVLQPLSDQFVERGAPIELRCVVEAGSRSEVRWYKNGVLIDPSAVDCPYRPSRQPGRLYTLSVREAFAEDAGVYRCVVSNSHGSTSCEALLCVAGEN